MQYFLPSLLVMFFPLIVNAQAVLAIALVGFFAFWALAAYLIFYLLFYNIKKITNEYISIPLSFLLSFFALALTISLLNPGPYFSIIPFAIIFSVFFVPVYSIIYKLNKGSFPYFSSDAMTTFLIFWFAVLLNYFLYEVV